MKLLGWENYKDGAWESDGSSFRRYRAAGNGMEAMIWKE